MRIYINPKTRSALTQLVLAATCAAMARRAALQQLASAQRAADARQGKA